MSDQDKINATFNPYRQLLGLPESVALSPNHYQLLGLANYEPDPDVISMAADRVMMFLRSMQTGPHAQDIQKLLNEVSSARICLLNTTRKAQYDQQLRLKDPPRVGTPVSTSSVSPTVNLEISPINSSTVSHGIPSIPGSVSPIIKPLENPPLRSDVIIQTTAPSSTPTYTNKISRKKTSPYGIYITLGCSIGAAILLGLILLNLFGGKNSKKTENPTQITQINPDQPNIDIKETPPQHTEIQPEPKKPDKPKSSNSELKRLRAQNFYNLAQQELKNGNFSKALSSIQQAIQIEDLPEFRECEAQINKEQENQNKVDGFLATARELEQKKLYFSALVNLKKAERLLPPDHFKRGALDEQKTQVTEQLNRLDFSSRVQAGNKAGDTLERTLKGVTYKFRWIPPGKFLMGSPITETARELNEKQHSVLIKRGFWMLDSEVTVAMWRTFLEDSEYLMDSGADGKGAIVFTQDNDDIQDINATWDQPGFAIKDDMPVVNISWNDALAFCRWFSEKLRINATLPTEAQWEYACRAGSETAFYFGSKLGAIKSSDGKMKPGKAHFDARYPYGMPDKWDSPLKPIPVRTRLLPPNEWGLHGMHGNVWEWTVDGAYEYTDDDGDGDKPQNLFSISEYVCRGGSWHSGGKFLRSAQRLFLPTETQRPDLGFRFTILCANQPEFTPTEEPPLKTPEEKESPDNPETQPNIQQPKETSEKTVPPTTPDVKTKPEKETAKPKFAEVLPGKKAGQKLLKRVDNVAYTFRWIPPGKFMMGSSVTELGRNEDEALHEVTLTEGFWMLETEVTCLMWKNFMEETQHVLTTGKDGKGPFTFINKQWIQSREFNWINTGFIQERNSPAVCIGWNDAQAFCSWLSTKIGAEIKLPTEAQWEYACRAGTKTPFYFGTNANSMIINALGSEPYGNAQASKCTYRTLPARKFPPNSWGLYDMHGNVWEWVADYYTPHSPDAATNPTGPSSGTKHVLKGGGWMSALKICRSASRLPRSDDHAATTIGVRIIMLPSKK